MALRRRGTTLVELTLVLTLTTVVLGVLATLYGYTMSRLGHATAQYTTVSDAVWAANAIEETVRDATECKVVFVDEVRCLKCTMPQTATDRDSDGYGDVHTPVSVTRRGWEKWATGVRVWYYMGGASGTPSQEGTTLYRAQRNDDLSPTGSDVSRIFSFVVGDSVKRTPLINGFEVSADASARTVTFSIKNSSLTRDERTRGAESTNQSYDFTETRKIAWRNGTK